MNLGLCYVAHYFINYICLASPGAVAALHYDMEDNFLLQLTGQKTVTLLSPEGYEIVQPFSRFDY